LSTVSISHRENNQTLEVFRLRDVGVDNLCESGPGDFAQLQAIASEARKRGVAEEEAAMHIPDFETVVQSWRNTVIT
jgi:hypothetical protein